MVSLSPVEHDPFAPSFVAVDHDPFATPQQTYRLAQHGVDTGPAVSPDYAAGPSLPGDIGQGAMDLMRWNMFGSPGFNPPEAIAGAANTLGDISQKVMTTDPIDRSTGQFSVPAIETSTNAALAMMGPGTIFRAAPAGSIGMFAGPKAATADLHMLDMAQELAAKGTSREDIWQSTGWYRGVDGGWKFEISDTGLAVEPGLGGVLAGPQSVIQHPALAAAYPQFRNITGNVGLTKGYASGKFASDSTGPFTGLIDVMAPNPDMLRVVAAHELQHPIQQFEGFARGANPDQFMDAARRSLAHYGLNDPKMIEDAALKAYNRAAGEVEAYNVEHRLNMTPQERMATPPWETQGVPDALQVVRRPPPRGTLPAVNYRIDPDAPPPQGIRAYHGSPYDFDKFDISRIGTGEGAQAYGHGLYFAENEGTARSYRDQLTGLRNASANSAMRNAAGDIDKAIEQTQRRIAHYENMDVNALDEARRSSLLQINRDKLKQLTEMKAGAGPAEGRMYEVNIAAHPDQFLDWDKPLSDHSQQVKEAFRPIYEGVTTRPAGEHFVDVVVPASGTGTSHLRGATIGAVPKDNIPTDLVQWAMDHDPRSGQVLYDHMARRAAQAEQTRQPNFDVRNPFEGSQMLRQSGIPGIKYLDQGSRGSGAGTHNFVVFDPKIIDIVRKYGIAALGAFPVGTRFLTPVDHDPFAGQQP